MNRNRLSLNTLVTKSAKIIFLFLFSMSLAIANEHSISQVIIRGLVEELTKSGISNYTAQTVQLSIK